MAASSIYFFKLFLLFHKQIRKSVGLLRKSQNVSPRTFKLFVRPYHDHGDIIYEQVLNLSYHQKVDSFQSDNHRSHKGNFQRETLMLRCFVAFYNSKSLDRFFKLIPTLDRS